MKFNQPKRGALVVCLWLILAGLIVFLLAELLFDFPGLFVFPIYIALVFSVIFLRRVSYRVELLEREVSVRRGFLFCTQKRLPLRFITGTHSITTPLLRSAGCCLLFIYTSGTVTVLPGLLTYDAEKIQQYIAARGELA